MLEIVHGIKPNYAPRAITSKMCILYNPAAFIDIL
jgi:hypothetical protein